MAGPFTVEHAMPIARQIAEALDAAHQRGVVHRDLKPANVKITPDGMVKVLDFGIAKILSDASPDDPTVTIDATAVGIVLGTPAYMAPEQIQGKPVDGRVDIWAFGVMLYKMVAGQRPFGGASSRRDWSRFSPPIPTGIASRRRCDRSSTRASARPAKAPARHRGPSIPDRARTRCRPVARPFVTAARVCTGQHRARCTYRLSSVGGVPRAQTRRANPSA